MEMENIQKIEGKKVEIKKVTADMDFFDETKVKKMTFETDKGNITFKPKTTKTELKLGIETNFKAQCTIDQVPQIIKDIAAEINTKGSVQAIVHYIKGEMEYDGETKTYRWVQGDKMIESWKIIKSCD